MVCNKWALNCNKLLSLPKLGITGAASLPRARGILPSQSFDKQRDPPFNQSLMTLQGYSCDVRGGDILFWSGTIPSMVNYTCKLLIARWSILHINDESCITLQEATSLYKPIFSSWKGFVQFKSFNCLFIEYARMSSCTAEQQSM